MTVQDKCTHATICNTTEARLNVFPRHTTTAWLNNKSSVVRPLEKRFLYSLNKVWRCSALKSPVYTCVNLSLPIKCFGDDWSLFAPMAKSARRESVRRRKKKERHKQHVRASNHQLTLFICCVVSARLFHHRSTVGLSEYIKTARKTESERKTEGGRKSIFLERLQHQLSVSLSLSFISDCVISFPHSVLLLSLCTPHTPFFSQKQSWELGAKGRRQTR